ncbi:DUF2786 domain-containing protein [Caenispirillum bisanense]|uniref:Uncharacterized protein n=1 Tax=Caenispirillum bisanense TaxID=414052 RepID=A0A286GYM9_9PROT|nr:DUF2786 domain-containing protein [Caenispirillum bisanense]SOE00635.1 Protein of unknown function [Caenispirillum bisanense]
MADKDTIKRRIQALLGKTTDRGCTDAEAEAAAAMAARLMSEHGLSREDLVMDVDRAPSTARPTAVDRLWSVLAHYTGCVSVREVGIQSRRAYVGEQPGPTIAVYLHTYLHRHIEAAVRRYQDSREYKRKKAGGSRRRACEAFRAGMAMRLERTLAQHFDRPDPARIAAAKTYLATLYTGLEADGTKKPSTRHMRAAAAGYVAGGEVEIRNGLAGGTAGLIGRE